MKIINKDKNKEFKILAIIETNIWKRKQKKTLIKNMEYV